MISVLLFAFAAALGAFLATLHFRQRGLPLPLALAHGAFAAAGLVALFLAGSSGAMSSMWQPALGLLVLAALGGFVLLSKHLRKAPLPNGLVLAHALLAVAGFVVLLLSVWE